MIRKLRLKFVAVCMLLVTAVLAAGFGAAYAAARYNIERNSTAVLQRVIKEDARFPNLQNGLFGNDQVKLPYFTVEVWGSSGTVYVTGSSYANLENTQELTAILSACMEQASDEGTLSGYNLRYLRVETPLYQRIAFVDVSAEKAAVNNLLWSFFQIALVVLAVLLGVSILLARWATRPVERAWQQQRRFLSDASHELKTPLTVILSNAELMRSAPLEPRLDRWSDNIHSEALQMKSLVEQMLTLARLDQAAAGTVFSTLSLSDLATDRALAFEPVAFENGKMLHYTIAPDLMVSGDGAGLRQLLSVLLDNAIKYSSPGTTVELSAQKNDRFARIQVSNQGEPIPPEQLPHLFERFYRADASRGEQSGFGLGLPIAAAIARDHKGTLRAESDAASTRFTFTIPLVH